MLAFCLALVAIPMPAATAANEDVGISYYEFTVERGNVIKPATLFIGTYMIEMPGLTGANFTEAMKSRETYKQDNKYYYTELASGKWRNIVSANDIKNIMPGGDDLEEASLYDLRITCYIGADGVPTNPTSMTSENPFESPDPYDLEKNQEFMEAWKLVRTNKDVTSLTDGLLGFASAQAKATDGRPVKDVLVEFFAEDMMPGMPIRDEDTDLMDNGIFGLWDPYLAYKESDKDGDSKKAEILYKVMGAADATRRAIVFEKIAVNENFSEYGTTLDALSATIGKDGGNEEDYKNLSKGEAAKVETRLLDITEAFASANKASKKAYATHAAGKFVRGNTAISQYRYDLTMEMMDKADGSKETIDGMVKSLYDLDNIEDDEEVDAVSEYKLMDEVLVPLGDVILAGYLTEGVPAGYPVADDSAASKALLESQKNSASSATSELKSFITKMRNRSEDDKTMLAAVEREWNWVVSQKGEIPEDDFATYAEQVRQDYETWLRQLADEIGGGGNGGDNPDNPDNPDDPNDPDDPDNPDGGGGNGGNGTPTPQEVIKKLEKEKGYAEKFDNPKKVQQIDEQIAAIKKKNGIDDEKKDTGNTNTGTGTNNGGNTSPYLPKGYSGNGGKLDTANKSNSSGDKAGNTGNASRTANKSGSGNTANKNGTGNNKASTAKKDAGVDSLSNKKLSRDDLDNLLKDLFGGPFGSLSSETKGAVVAALNQFGREHNNEFILNLARELLAEIMGEHNEFVYAKYKNNVDMEYVSFAAIDRARQSTRYRYVRVDLEATLSYLGGGISYIYNVGSDKVTLTGGVAEQLNAAVAEQTDSYIRNDPAVRYAYLDETDAARRLNVRAEYIVGSEYSVLVTASMEPMITKVIEALEAFYGGN